jgi:type IV pilus assembly protein PilB
MAIKLGELLVKEGLITDEQLEEALAHQKQHGGVLGSVLDQLGIIKESEITGLLSRQYGIPSVDLGQVEIDPEAVQKVPAETAQKYQILPIALEGSNLTIAMVDPTNVSALDDIKFLTGCKVEAVLASETAVQEAIEKHHESTASAQIQDEIPESESRELDAVEIDLDELGESKENTAAIKTCNLILTDAIRRNASEIHIESYEREYRVRYRIDGILVRVVNPPKRLRKEITRRFKLMARLDESEKQVPQRSGIRVRFLSEGKTLKAYFSISILPTVGGEKIFLRVNDTERVNLNLDELGFEPESLQRFDKALRAPGLVLVAGPMGSGKTTTVYSALERYNVREVNIVTVDEHNEYHLDGINQMQVQQSDYPGAVRAALSENPQILAVGQITDRETADVTMKAALQGPLVLSTMNANDTVTCIQRLASFDVSLNLIAASLQCICAQKLIRRICKDCRSPLETTEGKLREEGFRAGEAENIQLYEGRGCKTCEQSGYHGRVGLFEVLTVNDEIRDAVVRGLGIHEIRRIALGSGLMTLRESGLHKIRQGMTTTDEAFHDYLAWTNQEGEPTLPGSNPTAKTEFAIESKPKTDPNA